jgi:hypothetical protein
MRDHRDKKVRDDMNRERRALMENGLEFLKKYKQSPDLYSYRTHRFLEEHGWELLFPLGREEWPSALSELQFDNAEAMKWPHWTTYQYVMSVIAPPSLPHLLLNFGYAVLDGRLVKCAFFVVQRMVDFQIMPQGMVVDPMAVRDGKEPDFYFGCSVDRKELEDFLVLRENPLEMYSKRMGLEAQECNLEVAYMEAYCLQMATYPELCPQELRDWADGKRIRRGRSILPA